MTTWLVMVPQGDTVKFCPNAFVDKPIAMDFDAIDKEIPAPTVWPAFAQITGLPVYDAERHETGSRPAGDELARTEIEPPAGPYDPAWPHIEVSVDGGDTWYASRTHYTGSLLRRISSSSTGRTWIGSVCYRLPAQSEGDLSDGSAP